MSYSINIFLALILGFCLSCGNYLNDLASDDEKETYTVTYDANGAESGSVPVDDIEYIQGEEVAVLGNTGGLVKTGYEFTGWNTAPDGSGTTYLAGETFIIGTEDVILYAKWSPLYRVTYDPNGAESGSVPVDDGEYIEGEEVSVLGNTGGLFKMEDKFTGWNTAPDGSGTTYTEGDTLVMGTEDVTLYALWSEREYEEIYYNDFGTGAEGWSDSRTSIFSVSYGYTLLGGYLIFGIGANTERLFSELGDHTDVKILFGFFVIDSWDSEYGRLFADDVLVWSDSYNFQEGDYIDMGGGGWADPGLFEYEIEFSHSSDTLTLKFDTTLNQDPSAESWGVDYVYVYVK